MKKAMLILLLFASTCNATYFIEGKNYGDKVVISESNYMGFGYDDFSLCIWVRTTAGSGANAFIVEFFGSAGYGSYLEVDMTATIGKPRCKVSSGDPIDEVRVYSTIVINDGQWHLITVTCDRDVYHGNRMWIDGNDVSYW